MSTGEGGRHRGGAAPAGADVVVVAALHEEVAHVPPGVERVVTGVGKAMAAAGLARRLAEGRLPSLVVNVGTAGAVEASISGVVEIGYVTQHDFPYVAIEQLVGAPLERGFVLSAGQPPAAAGEAPSGVMALASADMFVADVGTAARIRAAGVHLVDMEAFAYAATCAAFGVPFRCAKAVSDAADEHAGLSWLDMVDHCALALGGWLEDHVLRSG